MTKSSNSPQKHMPFRAAPAQVHEVTPEAVAYYIAYGHRLRSAMVAQMMSRAWSAVSRLWRGDTVVDPATSEHIAEKFANSLAAIRSSAEHLRDSPDLSKVEHDRFVRIVLDEEIRLERMLDDLRATPGRSASAA
jgi:hypothetical protein